MLVASGGRNEMVERTRNLPEAWDATADLVVVGSGGAGLTAALTGALQGMKVLLLEKAAVLGGTTSVSGGGFWIAVNHHMAEEGVEDSPQEALEYMRACAGNQGNDDHIVALLQHGPEMVRTLEDRAGLSFRAWPAVGGTTDYRPWLPGAKPGARTLDAGKVASADLNEWGPRVRVGTASEWLMDKFDYYRQRGHVQPPGSAVRRKRDPGETVTTPEFFAAGSALIAQLLKGCLEQGVTIWTDTAASEILVENSRVVGVRATRGDGTVSVRADGGVMLGTGGFSVNEELKRAWLTRPLEGWCDVESNTGDGHLMGMAVGAGVAGLGDAWWMPQMAGGRNPDGTVMLVSSREDRHVPHTLIVNRSANRFMNEALNYYDAGEPFGTKEGGPIRNHPAWYLFDSQAREKYMIVASKFPGDRVPDWMVEASSLEDLAAKTELDPDAVVRTVDRFNGFARAGKDEDFDRGGNPWDIAWGDPNQMPNPSLGTLEKPPFYALEIRNGALATRGGLRVSTNAQVLSALPPFDPIPGLYAAGNCSDGAVAGCYTGPGATIGAAMTFGYLAALHVASHAPAPVGNGD
jgi:3-oxosteroid 1-dehydrogenase